MALSAFPYIGGKTTLSSWIIDHLPAHTTYVEPFGGSAAVLLNKPRSKVEVYNDLDGDIVQFFEVARERPDELAEWCRRVPFSEELHNEWTDEFYSGIRRDDPIERAGRFLFIRYTQFAGKTAGPSGFKRPSARDKPGPSHPWRKIPERIGEICERFQGVSVQRAGYQEIVDRYDTPETVFYCDPPYVDKESLYNAEGFSHTELEQTLEEIDGCAIVSYTDRPPGLYGDWIELEKHASHNAGTREGGNNNVTERLLCNFDPADEPSFVDADHAQARIGQVGGDA